MGERKHSEATSSSTGTGGAEAGNHNRPAKKHQPASNGVKQQAIHVADFLAMPITYPSTSLKPAPIHYLYVRAHTAGPARSLAHSGGDGGAAASGSLHPKGSAVLPDGRTLFLVNLPTDTTERHIKTLFQKSGAIEYVRFLRTKAVPILQDEESSGAEEDEDEDTEPNTGDANEYDKKSNKKGKGRKSLTESKQTGPPKIVPLPPLDPRQAVGSQILLPTASSAHVVFLDSSSLKRALSQAGDGEPRAWPDPFAGLAAAAEARQRAEEGPANSKKRQQPLTADQVAAAAAAAGNGSGVPLAGLAFLMARHQAHRPAHSAVRAHVDSAIAHYSYMRAHPPPKRAGIQGVTIGPDGELLDADGFVIVQRGGKYGRTGADGGGASVGVARSAQAGGAEDKGVGRKKKTKELQDFYRFQMREKQRERELPTHPKPSSDKSPGSGTDNFHSRCRTCHTPGTV